PCESLYVILDHAFAHVSRVNQAWKNGKYVDALRPVFDGENPRQCHQSSLRNGVAGVVGEAFFGRVAGQEHDLARASLEHARQESTRQQARAIKVDVENL